MCRKREGERVSGDVEKRKQGQLNKKMEGTLGGPSRNSLLGCSCLQVRHCTYGKQLVHCFEVY